MIKKSFLGLSILIVFSVMFLSSFVSAYGDLGYFLDRAAFQVQPVAQFFLGGYDYTGYLLFERFLFFLIIFGITFVVLKTQPLFKDQKNILVVISLVVPLLAVRYISFEWFNTVLMSYQVFGIALLSIIPFVIYFFFLLGIAPLASGHSSVRKIGWILFGCVYLGLYSTSQENYYSEVYLWTAFAALLFFLADKTIQTYFIKQQLKHHAVRSLADSLVKVQKDVNDLISHGAETSTHPLHWRYKEKVKERDELNKLILKGS
jgi:hypothetical protein